MLALFSCPKEVSITPYLSKEQIAAAREMDLLTYLRRFEPEELVHIGGDTYATRTHDSLKISNGKWCWWSRGIGGTTALDYLTMVEGGSFLDAVQRILGEPLHVPPKSEPIAPLPKTEFTLPPKHAETVVLLSKGEIDSKKVRVEFSLEDMDMSGFQKGATYEQIKAYVLEHTGLKVSSLYISQIKRKCGLDVGQNYNLSKKEDAKVPKCPPEKEAAIRDALKYFQMI